MPRGRDGPAVLGSVVESLGENKLLELVHVVCEFAVGEAVLGEFLPLPAMREIDRVLSRRYFERGEVIGLEKEVEREGTAEDSPSDFERVERFEDPFCDGAGRNGELRLQEGQIEG